MLSSSETALVSEASWILLNVTLGTTQQTSTAVSAGAIPHLVQTAASASDVGDVRHNALLTLGNIATESGTLRDVVLKERAFRPALDILASPSNFSPEAVNTAAWVMQACSAPMKFSTVSMFDRLRQKALLTMPSCHSLARRSRYCATSFSKRRGTSHSRPSLKPFTEFAPAQNQSI